MKVWSDLEIPKESHLKGDASEWRKCLNKMQWRWKICLYVWTELTLLAAWSAQCSEHDDKLNLWRFPSLDLLSFNLGFWSGGLQSSLIWFELNSYCSTEIQLHANKDNGLAVFWRRAQFQANLPLAETTIWTRPLYRALQMHWTADWFLPNWDKLASGWKLHWEKFYLKHPLLWGRGQPALELMQSSLCLYPICDLCEILNRHKIRL